METTSGTGSPDCFPGKGSALKLFLMQFPHLLFIFAPFGLYALALLLEPLRKYLSNHKGVFLVNVNFVSLYKEHVLCAM